MVKENSNGNQTAIYRFGDYELYPEERLLRRAGQPVLLAPKAFDALLCLVRRAGRLVTKAELMDTLWPATCERSQPDKRHRKHPQSTGA